MNNYENIIVTIINAIKDFIIAAIPFLSNKKINDMKLKEKFEEPPLVTKESSNNDLNHDMFIPDISCLEDFDITDESYIENIGTYLAADRNQDQLNIKIRE
ncbi:MAG: hypothetical protein ACLRSU_12410 [Thomasclavelia spiroformis]|uniref:hypothetical protein n=1 Tax=Thomasclavelia spiroformis TaxID=29348 RepID=UPI0039904C7B